MTSLSNTVKTGRRGRFPQVAYVCRLIRSGHGPAENPPKNKTNLDMWGEVREYRVAELKRIHSDKSESLAGGGDESSNARFV